nr:calpain-5-like [Paramormyrops kingsleyae]XP_023671773.1 calpain-5-like [Paramormyrops kingsleyae]
MSSSAIPFRGQKYSELKQACIKDQKWFEDPEFPASKKSLFCKGSPPGVVVWKRPGEICEKPRLFVEGISSHDLNQGMLGNCWFVAACSCLAIKPHLWKKVIPDWKGQEWNPKLPQNYAGIFHFQFWIFGEWLDVVVDDRLPTIDGKLVYCHSTSKNEFWSALLEKAYAKLFLCYENLDGGLAADAVMDFCGAMSEFIDLKARKYRSDVAQDTLFQYLSKVHNRDGIISSSIRASQSEREARMNCGLVKGHAYGLTGLRRTQLGKQKFLMVRLRNPWGNTEWTGAWCDGSQEWQRVGSKERKMMNLTVKDDGEFWMAFSDWCRYFMDADVCHVISTAPEAMGKTMHTGKWTKDRGAKLNRSGGNLNNEKTFLQNPQYLFDVVREEEEVLIDLIQRDMRMQKVFGQEENLAIGFSVMKVENLRESRVNTLKTERIVATSEYILSRSVFMRETFRKGSYVVIPTTFSPGQLGDFIIRIVTEEDSGCRELTD